MQPLGNLRGEVRAALSYFKLHCSDSQVFSMMWPNKSTQSPILQKKLNDSFRAWNDANSALFITAFPFSIFQYSFQRGRVHSVHLDL
jgi:hypothetical protein